MTTQPKTAQPYMDPRTDAQRAAATQASWAEKHQREKADFRTLAIKQAEDMGQSWTEESIKQAWSEIIGFNKAGSKPGRAR